MYDVNTVRGLGWGILGHNTMVKLTRKCIQRMLVNGSGRIGGGPEDDGRAVCRGV